MNYEFTADEINELIRAARVFCPGFSEEQYHDLMELEKRLADSGYLEAVRGLAQLEEEKGIPCTEVLDAYAQLLRDQEQLEGKMASLQQKLMAQQNANQEAENRYQRMKESIEQARGELEKIQRECQKEERRLAALTRKAEMEKRRIDKELEEYRQRANVIEEEIVTAGQLKVEVEKHGLSLELMLALSQEFADHKDAREELAKALKESQTLSGYIASLNEQAREREKMLQSGLNNLQSQKDKRQTEIQNLELARRNLEGKLSQLQINVNFAQELRMFYNRYYGWSGLLEWLASWNQISFLRCSNPIYIAMGALVRSAGPAHVWTDKPGRKCPHCGLDALVYNEKLYEDLNLPVGAAIKIQLGE